MDLIINYRWKKNLGWNCSKTIKYRSNV